MPIQYADYGGKASNYAIGAGAVSKFVYLDENRIERVDDVKNLTII